jgi:hypothetical protein
MGWPAPAPAAAAAAAAGDSSDDVAAGPAGEVKTPRDAAALPAALAAAEKPAPAAEPA